MKLAFYDLDGTIVSSNVVHQYLWLARRSESPSLRMVRVGLLAPFLKLTDLYSRRLFNRVFYGEYRGLGREWLEQAGGAMLDEFFLPRVYPGVAALLESNRRLGFLNVMVTGSLDFAIAPLAAHLGFDRFLANSLEFRDGVATGGILPPILAGQEKVRAIQRLGAPLDGCRAYSDDTSDLALLEAVGFPTAANPKPSLRRIALQRGWPVVDLRNAA